MKLTKSEEKFINLCNYLGHRVYRNGWPDFLIKKGQSYIAVEVKSGRTGQRRLSVNQWVMLTHFNKITDIPVYFYNVKRREFIRVPKNHPPKKWNKKSETFGVNEVLGK